MPTPPPVPVPAVVDRTPAVLGDVVTRSVRSGQLPRTGDDLATALAPLGFGLLLARFAVPAPDDERVATRSDDQRVAR